jgi:hypothetical protein
MKYTTLGKTGILRITHDNSYAALHDLYYQLATHTTASHAGLYNDACYGNVYCNTLEKLLSLP